MTKDPVCLMEIDEQDAMADGLMSERDGQMQYFCSEECKQKYDENPQAYGMRGSEFQQGDEDVDLFDAD